MLERQLCLWVHGSHVLPSVGPSCTSGYCCHTTQLEPLVITQTKAQYGIMYTIIVGAHYLKEPYVRLRGIYCQKWNIILIVTFSFVCNHLRITETRVFDRLERVLHIYLFHGVRHVSPPCFYCSPEQTDWLKRGSFT